MQVITMHLFRCFIAACLFAALVLTSANASADDMTAALNTMADSISAAVERTDTDHPVFHGCIDWHSAVHGHWALLRIARATGGPAARAGYAERGC